MLVFVFSCGNFDPSRIASESIRMIKMMMLNQDGVYFMTTHG